MILNRTKSFEDRIWACPGGKLRIDDRRKFCEGGKETVVKAEAAQQFPNPLDWIELRAIGRQKVKAELRLLELAPFGMQRCMMILGVVGNDDDTTTGSGANPAQVAEEIPAALGIEASAGFGVAELAIAKPHRSKVTDAFAGWRMLADRIDDFRWHPHPATTAVLLEMDFIHCPKIDGGILGEFPEFFFVQPVIADRPMQFEAGVCAAGNPSGETTAGTAARAGSPPVVASRKPTRADHPKAGPRAHSPTDCRVTPFPPARDRLCSNVMDALSAPRRSIPQTHPVGNDAPNTPQSAAHRPTRWPHGGSSCPAPP